MIILPLEYFGSIEYWAYIVQGGEEVIIDLGENYVKRTQRNRTEIMTSGGIMQLSVQLQHANRPRQPMQHMRIDYSKRWQHQHLIAMKSAYRSSPYYDYYAERFDALLNREWEHLVELNLATLEAVSATLKIAKPRISHEYVHAENKDTDMRDKRRVSTFKAEPYVQVFSHIHEFAPNLSIYDLIMCEGPEAVSYLKRCKL